MARYLLIAGVFAFLAAGAPPAAGQDGGADGTAPAKALTLDELKAVIQPMLDELNLTEQQQGKANGVMSADSWSVISDGFTKKRKGEIFTATHSLMPELIQSIVRPKMMAYNMTTTMEKRMAAKAGPPSKDEIKAIQDRTRATMKSKIRPTLMDNLRRLAEERVNELTADKKVMVRVLAEKVSDIVLTDEQQPKFEKALTDAGYTRDLIRGRDPVLDERGKALANEVATQAIEEFKKEAEGKAE